MWLQYNFFFSNFFLFLIFIINRIPHPELKEIKEISDLNVGWQPSLSYNLRPFQLVFLFLVWGFPWQWHGGQGLSNLETKYFKTKHYSSLTPYTTAKWDTYKKAQKEWIKHTNMTDMFPILLNNFSLLGWWQLIYNSPRIHHMQKSSCWKCVRRNYWCGRRTRNRNTTWKGH